jgi:hypothetical protein
MVGEDIKQDIKMMEGHMQLIIEHGKYYVVGEGLLLPVKSFKEGLDLIKEIEGKKGSE